MAKVKLSVSIADEHRHRFADVVKKIKKAGMNVEQEMDNLGIVTGSIEPEKLSSLHKVEGVSGVEEERDYQIPPPESNIQ
jgi:hypothetical protein